MARLNDPPQPVGESVDALKRRFVRQNRELARVNSTQSVRTRNLEGEVSRLLAENVTLREQVIKLNYEVENKHAQSEWDKVESLKQKLGARLAELGGLLQELGDVQSNAASKRPAKRKSTIRMSPKRSPNQRNWKNALTLAEVTGDADGKLPPIPEDKCFPRKTLNGDELQGIFTDPNNLTDSPDLGPPPIAHFYTGDPIKFNENEENGVSREKLATALPVNLETRKKRRESFHQRESNQKRDGTDLIVHNVRPEAPTASAQPLKVGAKRKLTLCEENDRPSLEADKDEFRFKRKNGDSAAHTVKPKISSRDKAIEASIDGVQGIRTENLKDKSKNIIASTGRKALGPKSVNSDPHSPAKAANLGSKDNVSTGKDGLTQRIRDRNEKKIKEPYTNVQKVVTEIEVARAQAAKSTAIPPKTPIPPGLDLFSPSVSDPSESRPELRDTPPPPDLGPDTGTGSFGRGSRRPRVSVSYAEPSLRDKMRRPTKELVDAVSAGERNRQVANMKKESSASSLGAELEKLGLESAAIEQEENPEPMPMWKTKPLHESHGQKERQKAETASPLGNKASSIATEPPTSMVTDRRRRVSSLSFKDADRERAKPTSGAGTAIATLSASNPTARRREDTDIGDDVDGEDAIHEGGERTSIFDFTGSSPEDLDKRSRAKDEAEGLAKPMRVSRRHSSVPSISDQTTGSLAMSRRRRATILENEGVGNAKVAERPALQSTEQIIEIQDENNQYKEPSRGARAANRRRSMML